MTTEDFLAHVRARGATVITTRTGAVVTCPAHDDKRPSLSVRGGRDGRVLLHCRAGCRNEDVVQALGLRLAELFPAASPRPQRRRRARSPLAQARAAAIDLGRRQGWARPGVLGRYEAADLLRKAERLRARYRGQAPTDDERVWARLAVAAYATTHAENVLAGGAA